jgi:hypothetical protein
MADLRACGPIALAGGVLGTCDESARGHESLDPREAADVLKLIEQDHTHKLADAGNGLSALQGLRMVLLGRVDNGPRDIAAPLIIVVNQGEVDCDTLLHGGIREPFRHPVPVRLVGQLLPARGPVVLAVGLLDVREELGAVTCQLYAAPAPVAGGTHLGGIDVGRREHPATQQNGDVLGVERVVFGLAAVDRLHRPRLPADQGHLCLGAEVGEPGPGQESMRPRRPDPPDRVQWPCELVREPPSSAGEARSPPPDSRCRGTWCARARRGHHKICAAWGSIA